MVDQDGVGIGGGGGARELLRGGWRTRLVSENWGIFTRNHLHVRVAHHTTHRISLRSKERDDEA